MFFSRDLSLISPQAIGERGHRGLLIQFILSEILNAYRSVKMGHFDQVLTFHPRFFPYDWTKEAGYLNKVKEHALLLEKSFPECKKAVKKFEVTLQQEIDALLKKKKPEEHYIPSLQKIFFCLEPLITQCKEDENVHFLLLKNREVIDSLIQKGHLHQFLLKIHPSGLETLGEKMCDQYHQRGFFSQIPEFKLLLTQLLHV